MMNYKISQLLPILFSFVLISCSDSEISSSDVPEITQAIFVVPESVHGEPYKQQYTTAENFYVDINEKLKICGIYAINGEYISTEQSTEYYNTHKWIIDNNEAGAASIYYSFDKAGLHKVTFETIDHLGDTLRTNANIYVSTPTSIALQSPSNGFNQIDGNNPNGVELSWNIYGIDSWEKSTCVLYASYSQYDLWQSSLGEMNCFESVMLQGKLDLEIDENAKVVDHTKNTSTIYWGVRAIVKNQNGYAEQAFSEIFSFSTKLQNNGNAIIEIPVSCKFNQYPENSILKGAFLSAAGDTLSTFLKSKGTATITESLPPQSNIKMVVCDSLKTEYGCSSMTFDLAASTKTVMDTLFLQDKVKPNMVPVATELETSSDLKFYVLDNGSGVNASKTIVTMNNDTLQTNFENNILSFRNTCKSECDLVISAEDYAKNKAPDVYWKILVYKAKTLINGPFSRVEGNK